MITTGIEKDLEQMRLMGNDTAIASRDKQPNGDSMANSPKPRYYLEYLISSICTDIIHDVIPATRETKQVAQDIITKVKRSEFLESSQENIKVCLRINGEIRVSFFANIFATLPWGGAEYEFPASTKRDTLYTLEDVTSLRSYVTYVLIEILVDQLEWWASPNTNYPNCNTLACVQESFTKLTRFLFLIDSQDSIDFTLLSDVDKKIYEEGLQEWNSLLPLNAQPAKNSEP